MKWSHLSETYKKANCWIHHYRLHVTLKIRLNIQQIFFIDTILIEHFLCRLDYDPNLQMY